MRLISLCPSLTKLVFDLGAGTDLVGVTRYCIEPAAGVELLEKLGGTKDPRLERIGALKPDLVLLNQEENRREDYESLVEMGIRCNVTYPLDVDGAIAAIVEIANLIGRAEAGARLVAQITQVRQLACARREQRLGLRWAYLIWRKPWMAIGPGTYIDGLLRSVGGRNVFADLGAYPAISAADLSAADPHLIILSSEPFPFKEKHRKELSTASGLPIERFVLASGEHLSWHCSYTAEGLQLADKLMESCT